MSSLSERFLNGLKKHNLSLYEIQNKDWIYCGGSKLSSRHERYFRLKFSNEDFPQHKSYCICQQKIKQNCYITNGVEKIVLGSCCIKRFLPKGCSGRTCQICKQPHRNQGVDVKYACKIYIQNTRYAINA